MSRLHCAAVLAVTLAACAATAAQYSPPSRAPGATLLDRILEGQLPAIQEAARSGDMRLVAPLKR